MADTEQQLKMVKSMLRATLISSKEGIPADTLLRDYEELTGETLPFKPLGFSSLKEFIQSIPDVVEVIRNEVGRTLLFAVASNSNKHIMDMVLRQKCKKFKGFCGMADTEQQLKMVKSMLRATLISSKEGIPADTLLRDYEELTGEILPFKSLGFSSLKEFIQSIPDVVEVIRNEAGRTFLFAVSCESNKHILDLVQRQKSGGCKKFKEARKPFPKTEYIESKCGSNKHDQQHATSRKPLLKFPLIPTQRRAVFDRLGPSPKVQENNYVGLSKSANMPCQNSTDVQINIARTLSGRGSGRKVKEASKPLSKTEDTEAGCRSTKPDRQHTTSRKPLLESSIIQTQRTAVFQTLGTKPKVLDHDHVGLSRSANVPYQNITGASRTPSVRGCGRRVKLNI